MNPDLSLATRYHYGAFPPQRFDLGHVVDPLLEATDALARYDQMLKGCTTAKSCSLRCEAKG